MQQLLVMAEKDGLSATVQTLKTELIVSHEEVERAFTELDSMRPRRTRTLKRELRETQLDFERCRMEHDDWKQCWL